MIAGFAAVLVLLVAVVVDASAAILRRQQLDALADAAALAATDGVQGEAVYTRGLGRRAEIDPVAARRFVAAYLGASGRAAGSPGWSTGSAPPPTRSWSVCPRRCGCRCTSAASATAPR
jgi:Flp pilus assembly protein TadG